MVNNYNQGFNFGISWDANQIPTGPPRFKGKIFPQTTLNDYACEVWLKGFNDGFQLRLEDEDFKTWWDENSGKTFMRYVSNKTED